MLQIHLTNLNLLGDLRWEIFHPCVKLQIAWILIVIIAFCIQKLL